MPWLDSTCTPRDTARMGDEVTAFLAEVTPDGRRADAVRLAQVFGEVTGFAPRLWPGGIVGYGRYDYRYDSGRTGQSFATGFAPRKSGMVLHIMPGYANFDAVLARLGPVRRGKACLYLPRLAKLDEAALRNLIAAGLADLARHWSVHPA